MRFRFFASERFSVPSLFPLFFFCETFKKLVLEPQLLSRVCNFLRIFILCFQLSSIHRYISRRCRSNDFIWSIYRSQGRVELVKRAPWRFSDDVRAELKLTIISFQCFDEVNFLWATSTSVHFERERLHFHVCRVMEQILPLSVKNAFFFAPYVGSRRCLNTSRDLS